MTDVVPPRSPDGPPVGRLGWQTAHGRSPALGPVFVAIYRLLLRSVATRGRLLAIAALDGVCILMAVAVATSTATPLSDAMQVANGALSTLVPVAVLLFGAATLGDLVDDGSLVYLWLRPLPSWVIVAAAWAATVTVSLPLVGVPVLASVAIISTDGPLLSGVAIALLVGVATYSALFVTGGLRFRRAFVWGLAYILLWEGFVARAGETASKLAVRSYVRSILARQSGIDLNLGDFSLPVAIVVPLLAGGLALLYAVRRLARTDVA